MSYKQRAHFADYLGRKLLRQKIKEKRKYQREQNGKEKEEEKNKELNLKEKLLPIIIITIFHFQTTERKERNKRREAQQSKK